GAGAGAGAGLAAGSAGTDASERGGVGAALGGVDGWVTVVSFRLLGAAAVPRAGLVSVTSLGPNESTSLEPVGRTCRKSPSAGSPSATTLPDFPSATPTAAAVNHTIGGFPSASSPAMRASSASDRICG